MSPSALTECFLFTRTIFELQRVNDRERKRVFFCHKTSGCFVLSDEERLKGGMLW